MFLKHILKKLKNVGGVVAVTSHLIV